VPVYGRSPLCKRLKCNPMIRCLVLKTCVQFVMYNRNDYYLFRAIMLVVKEIFIKKAQCYILSCLVMGEDLHIVIRDP